MVLYPISGDIMRAAKDLSGAHLYTDTLYHWRATSDEGAAYLISLVNAPALTAAFHQARISGRQFDLSPCRSIPIPTCDPNDSRHTALAGLAIEAEHHAAACLSSVSRLLGQVGLSKQIRDHLVETGTSYAIDDHAKALLPDHTT